MSWQPIETAPRGIPVLTWGLWPGVWGYREDEWHMHRAVLTEETRNGQVSRREWRVLDGVPTFFHENSFRPTHWMPLPEPPK